ncbi:MAG: aminodeoxychorismate/anthranilate synthase component II [Thermoanaerobaculales bacterium]|nr:aminodeoxychorismate/anthranilate synthase component II [Thermoanaerobaculales bacterium]
MVDNYDSFTYNLVQELAEISGAPIEVVRNDAASAAELLDRRPRAIVISPGPGTPDDAGVSLELIRTASTVPLLGICLGLQSLAAVHGGVIVRAPAPVHGKTSEIHHRGASVMAGLPSPFTATRYHSLVVDRATVPDELEVTAWTDDGLVMGLAHRSRPHHAVQFHPESYLTGDGMRLLANFLGLAGLEVKAGWR